MVNEWFDLYVRYSGTGYSYMKEFVIFRFINLIVNNLSLLTDDYYCMDKIMKNPRYVCRVSLIVHPYSL